jgi:hypothetical protein
MRFLTSFSLQCLPSLASLFIGSILRTLSRRSSVRAPLGPGQQPLRRTPWPAEAVSTRTALVAGCTACSATRKHLAARSRDVGLLTLLIPLWGERLGEGFVPYQSSGNGCQSWRLPWSDGEEVAMKLTFDRLATLEQLAARKAAIDGMGHALRDLWKDDLTALIPERLLYLLA